MIRWGVFNAAVSAVAISAAAAPDVRTEYSIGQDRAGVMSSAPLAGGSEAVLRQFLLPRVVRSLTSLPSVAQVTTMLGEERLQETPTLAFDTRRRLSSVVVHLRWGSNVGLLFKVDESYRECVSRPQLGSGTVCYPRSELSVVGPLKVYGVFTSFTEADQTLRDKQNYFIEADSTWDRKEIRVNSQMSVTSALFESALLSFVKDFGLRRQVDTTALRSRRTVLMAAARLMRTINEGIFDENP
jgi:hypothetical protein